MVKGDESLMFNHNVFNMCYNSIGFCIRLLKIKPKRISA